MDRFAGVMEQAALGSGRGSRLKGLRARAPRAEAGSAGPHALSTPSADPDAGGAGAQAHPSGAAAGRSNGPRLARGVTNGRSEDDLARSVP
jgi:hypothetical protein